MVTSQLRPLALAALGFVASAAQPQPTASPSRPDPLDAKAAVPAVVYASSFAASKAAVDPPAPSWREANDTVARIGGWRAYAREAQQPDPAPSAPAAAPAKTDPKSTPMPQGHGGHKMP
jgi:hypothetical protein